ncbi:hypothetical protein [Streptomyces melanogenes]|uniref:hypothetical protein n=1 Tax=Streptomyces melanogenes TaxID=67326 RepID=UPI0037A919EC
MVPESYSKKTVGWIAGATLAATVVGVTACSRGTNSAAENKPTTGTSATGAPSIRQSTPEEAVATWVTAVIKGQPNQACLVMAQPATGSSPAQVGTPSMCDGNTSEAREMRDKLGRFRTSFTPKPPPTSDPKVEVAQVPVTGDKAVVPADKVTIDGQTLDQVILPNSTGLQPGQLHVKTESAKIDNAWYVTAFDLNVG